MIFLFYGSPDLLFKLKFGRPIKKTYLKCLFNCFPYLILNCRISRHNVPGMWGRERLRFCNRFYFRIINKHSENIA